MITDHIIAYVNGSVSAGKESVLFWGVNDKNDDVALKIYLLVLQILKNVNHTSLEIQDSQILKKGTKNLVYLMGKKGISQFISML